MVDVHTLAPPLGTDGSRARRASRRSRAFPPRFNCASCLTLLAPASAAWSWRPRWPLRLPGGGADGVMRARGGVLERLLHVEDRPVLVRAAQGRSGAGSVLIGAWGHSRGACEVALERMRFALGVDDDLGEFHRRFRRDPLLGAAVRRMPWLRPGRRPEPFEALAWAVCEQLIEYARAVAIERRIVRALGRGAPQTTLRDLPSAGALAGASPALRESFDLSSGRALARRRAAREVAAGRVALGDPDHERGWRRLPRDPRHRQLDRGVSRAARSGALRPAARRRPWPAQARRSPSDR